MAVTDLEAPIRDALSSGNLPATVMLAFAAGVATSLTPCVYPMIAITVSIFGARQSESRLQGALLSTAFVAGMATLFVPLGLAAALTGGVFGTALANPWVLVGMALLFATLAASMFGAFALDLPAGLKTRLADMGGVGLKGAFALGMVSALIAAPCTGPVLGALLTWVSSSRDVATGGLALLAYALGLGLLFWVVGTFAIALPKSGRWLGWVKSFFGIVMLTMAVYYVRPLLPELPGSVSAGGPETLLLVGLASFTLGLALGAIHLSFEYTSRPERLRKAAGVLLSVAGLSAVLTSVEVAPGEGLVWRDDFLTAATDAKAHGKPLLVDFSASWCGACGELERRTFSHPDVVREAQRFVKVRVDLSPGKDTPEKRALLARYAQRGLPLVVIHDAAGRESSRVTGYMEPAPFLSLLRGVD